MKSLGLIDLPTSILNSIKFNFFVWPMVLRQFKQPHSIFSWQNCAAISNIYTITFIFNSKYNYCASSRFINSWSLICHFQEGIFSYSAAFLKSFHRIWREARLFGNNLMQIIFQKISTITSSMTIINCKERAFRPISNIWSLNRSIYIQNNRYSIFIIISLYSLMSISRITSNEPMSFWGKFCLFKIF